MYHSRQGSNEATVPHLCGYVSVHFITGISFCVLFPDRGLPHHLQSRRKLQDSRAELLLPDDVKCELERALEGTMAE